MYAIKEFVFEFLSCTSGQHSGPQALLYSRDRARLYRDLQLKLLPIHHGAKPLMPLEDSTKFEGCRPGGYFTVYFLTLPTEDAPFIKGGCSG
jgi:hypothetical protein